jgi:hypothetical protein
MRVFRRVTSGARRYKSASSLEGRLGPGVQLIVKPFNFAGLATKIRHIFDGA